MSFVRCWNHWKRKVRSVSVSVESTVKVRRSVFRNLPCESERFGFVIIPEEDQDIFIGEDDAGGALDGDTVEVIITKASDCDGKRREGKIVKIVERGLTTVVGLYQKKGNKSYGFVIPDNQRILQDIFIPEVSQKRL